MGAFDIFYDAHDGSDVTQTSRTANISGATWLNPEGSDFTLSSAVTFVEGEKVRILDASTFVIAYCNVTKVTDSTHITLRPIQSASDTATLPHQFANNSGITTQEEPAARCVIDLSGAPEDAYNFLVVACGTVESSGTPGGVTSSVRLNSLQGDSFSGTSGYGSNRMDTTSANPDRPNFVCASSVSLVGGQRYSHALNVLSNTSGQSATVSSPRILALRYSSGYVAGDGKTTEQTTTSTSYVDVTGLDLGANLPAGDYLIVSTWATTNSSTSNRSDVALEADGSTVLTNHVCKPGTANDYVPGGFFGVITLGATNRVRLRIKASATTAKIKNAFLAAIPIANIPAIAATHANQSLSIGTSQSVTDNNYVTMQTSSPVTLEKGRHIEIVSASIGGDNPVRSRPVYRSGAADLITGIGSHNMIFGTASTDYTPTFWFVRNERDAGSTTNAVSMRRNTAVTTALRAQKFAFSWLREQPDFRPLPDERVAVVADIELGGRVYKNWNSTTTSGRYSKRLSDVTTISRVIVSDTEYSQVASLGALTDGSWFWDSTNMDLYVELPSGDTPADDDIVVIVVPSLLVGREKEDLVNSSAETLPYAPLLKDVPGSTQRLTSSRGAYSASTSLGSLKLVAADRRFDDALLTPATFEGFRAKIRRGFTRKSHQLVDFEVVGDAVLGLASSDFESVTLRLLDRRLLIQRPIATTAITVKESFGADARDREDQSLPILYGSLKRVIAYRVTANVGGSDWNEFQFCGHGIKSISAVYLDGTTAKPISSGNLNVTSTYIDNGKVRVNNAAFPTTTEPANVVYVDLVGSTTTGASTGTAIQTPGAIARHLLVTYGGVQAKQLVESSFRMIDREWRYQLDSGIVPVAPKVGLVISGAMNSADALTELCKEVFAYWKVNRQGRIALDVPDLTIGNLSKNPGFEDDSTSGYPWTTENSATFATTTSRKYEGARSAEVTNGGTPNASAALKQAFSLPAGGTYVVTCMASLLVGSGTDVRIGVTGPSGDESLSDAFTIATGRWTRLSMTFESQPGDAGHAEVRIYPAHGSTTATSIALDNVEVYRVAVVADSTRSIPRSLSFMDEHYYEAAVTYDVNLQSQDFVPERTIADMEARGLSSALPSEGKYAIQSSRRIEVKALATDRASAAGIGAPVVLHYSRQRHELEITIVGIERLPIVGEYLYHRLNPRVPEMANEYPIWRITEVRYDDANAKVVRLKAERQNDPVLDRIDIAPDSIPMGAIALTRSASGITDFTAVSAMENQFALGHTKPDTSTQRGAYHHKHDLSHTHSVPSHTHNVTPSSHGLDKTLGFGAAEGVGKYTYPASVGPQEPTSGTRGATDGGHNHSVPGSPLATGSTSSTSAAQTGTLETSPGPVEPSFRRVRFMQRTAAATTTLSQDLIVGIRSASIPAGWSRVTELDGYYIRGATSNTAVSTTVATSTYTPSDSGSTLKVASATGITVGKRLRVRRTDDGDKEVHVVVTAISGTDLTVIPLHETTNQPNTYTFPAGASSTVVGQTEVVDTAYTAPTHSHGGTMSSHTHSAGGHVHAEGSAIFELGAGDNGKTVQKWLYPLPSPGTSAPSGHVHSVRATLPASNATSSSAGGSVTGDVSPAPPYYELVFIKPADANQTTLPAGAVLFWTQSNTPPSGYQMIGAARGHLIKGAAASPAAVGSSSGGHTHSQSNTAHTLSHSHGGTVIVDSDGSIYGPSGLGDLVGENSTSSTIAVALGSESYEGGRYYGGHGHAVTCSVSATDPGLSSGSGTTGSADETLPLCKRIMLIQKL